MEEAIEDLDEKGTQAHEKVMTSLNELEESIDELNKMVKSIGEHLEKETNKATEEIKEVMTEIARERRRERRKTLFAQVCVAILAGVGITLLSVLLT